MPCHPARARELLAKKRAVVVRRVPFVIRLKDRAREDSTVQGVQIRIDPGSRSTGIAVTDGKQEADHDEAVVTVRRGLVALEVRHRGRRIRDALQRRSEYRSRRRGARLRYRAPRFDNRTRPDRCGFPRLRLTRTTVHYGFQTGDLVRATVPRGRRAGTYTGRVAVRASGGFNITTAAGTVQGIHHSHVRLLQRADGCAYTTQKEAGALRSEPKAGARAADRR
ncbi:hypothetical protein GCM10023084_23380 [Streptomyces lacrimifluminis]|uniref:RRXRR domain-containing protein n=2 Tax=Streptomyces lacrimifluminis TaxID=1500077 RepID=A0A917L9J6_9ACTN|nr:hypothetical protein GCM10012282_57110 [Streptomyces lacrimifluminis]